MQRLWYRRWASLRSSAGASLLLSYILTYQKRRKTHEEIVSSTNQETISGPSSRRSLMSQTVSPHEISPATASLADRVIRAGAIYSMAADRKVYRAIALRGGWIVAVSEDPHGLDWLG